MIALEHPPLACRTSPPQGGRLCPWRLSPIFTFAGVGGQSKLPISPLEGEMAGRPEGGGTERGLHEWAAP
ncbi:MAG: hypothetical protein E5Y32_23815 [Mesorhizobium sp.]|nr:MAG: hypothetical protein E5Y67_15220 [Mesorhizobium sp.]TIN39997.1 MAG: hypothetical protein E5Y32_23815 [Mesorhizobium sp.]